MSQHPHARLTPRGRGLLCKRVGCGMRVADAAAMAGVSRQTVRKRLRRCERERPDELVPVDVKRWPAPPDGDSHRALRRSCGSPRGAGASCLHVAVDERSRVACAELLPQREKGRRRHLHGPRAVPLRGPPRRGRAHHDRQRPGQPLRRLQRAARGPRDKAQVHQAVQPLAERPDGEDKPHPDAEVVVCEGLGERGVQGRGPGLLHRTLPMSRIVGVNNVLAGTVKILSQID